ncbi:MAG TPA: ABC transporter permease [Acidimicrobiales bacterium]|nr:ABC transporter permease [Acidimicrobiales bacterium]HLN42845.1 ABC transporter permease [Acidimicrobiales bacterium]
MNEVRDLVGVAWAGLKARKVRTLLILLGPVIGVAAMVSAVGLTESAKGALQAQLSQLGTNLIIAQAGGTFGSQNPTFPSNAVQRVENVSTVTSAAATTNLSGVISLPIQGASSYYQAFPVPVRAADDNLPSVLDVPLLDGRWLDTSDSQLHLRSVVLGSGIARQYGYLPGEVRTILLNGTNFGVVGVLGPVALDPDLDNAAFVTQWAAKHVLGTNGLPNQLYIRAVPGTTQGTANVIPTAINLGGPDQVSTKIPSDVLQAAAQANRTLQEVALLAGLLALTVGGIGIANVMSISVIQRSAEIGIRRAVGHSRSKIGGQFLLESLFVGVLGGVIGAVLGVGVVYVVSAFAGWVVVIAYGDIPIWMGLALFVSVAAGLYPSIKAARLEPLETLRLG